MAVAEKKMELALELLLPASTHAYTDNGGHKE